MMEFLVVFFFFNIFYFLVWGMLHFTTDSFYNTNTGSTHTSTQKTKFERFSRKGKIVFFILYGPVGWVLLGLLFTINKICDGLTKLENKFLND